MVNVHIVKYMIEIQNTSRPAGHLCTEGVEVEVRDEGAGPFITLETRNLEPDKDYASGVIGLDPKDIGAFCNALKNIATKLEVTE